MKKTKKSLLAFGIAILAMTAVTACQSSTEGSKSTTTAVETQKDPLSEMKEFAPEDGTFSMLLDKEWVTEDSGMDNWLVAANEKGDTVVMVMQFPKNTFPIGSISELDDTIKKSMTITNQEDMDAPSVVDFLNTSAYTCDIVADGAKGKSYILLGETEYAYYGMTMIAQSKFDKHLDSFIASGGSFKEIAPEAEDNSTVEATDTINWFNASYGVLTKINNQDLTKFGGLPANDLSAKVTQETLSSWWGVTDRESAEENLNWIMSEGHRTGFAEVMSSLDEALAGKDQESRAEAVLEIYDVTAEEAENLADMYVYYENFGENAIEGWDYCRAMSLLGWYYLADYYTEQEALDQAMDIAVVMQESFSSWDEMMDSYLRGYEYWAEESSDERRAVYEDLKAQPNSPFNIDWNLTLEKTW